MFGFVFKIKFKCVVDIEIIESIKEIIEDFFKIFIIVNFLWNNNVECSRESNVVIRVGDEEELDIGKGLYIFSDVIIIEFVYVFDFFFVDDIDIEDDDYY